LGFVTSFIFIFLVGVFMSSWVGTSLLALGEWFIIKMPLMSYIYAASKQISAAISP
ncbi:UNVERIFIED_CONTAM: protein LIKE COV 3, partial [Sesamum radiatum]